MKPAHIKEKREKCVRKILKRQREIWKETRDLGYTKLEKPIRHGWFKEIVITTKIERYKNQVAILELYERINKTFWGATKEKAEQEWQRYASKNLIYKDLPTISKKQYNKLSYKGQQLCTAFRYKTCCKKWKVRFYVRLPKAAYRVKFTRAYITHSKRIDPNLESESDLLEQQLYKNGFYGIGLGFNYGKDRWGTSEHRKEKLKTKRNLSSLKRHTIEEILKDNTQWERN